MKLPGFQEAAVHVLSNMAMADTVDYGMQERQQAQPLDDPEVLARKAASLDQQRSRFRRALGAQDDVPEIEPALAVCLAASWSKHQTYCCRALHAAHQLSLGLMLLWLRLLPNSCITV